MHNDTLALGEEYSPSKHIMGIYLVSNESWSHVGEEVTLDLAFKLCMLEDAATWTRQVRGVLRVDLFAICTHVGQY